MENKEKRKFVAYCRVSSKRQKDDGVSLEAQQKLLKDYASRNDIVICKTFEIDESAKENDRLIFQEMIALVAKDPQISGIICEKVDRLLRGNLKDRVKIEDLINISGKEIHFVKEGLIMNKDTKSSQKLHFDIQNALARHFLNNLSDEVRKGYDILVDDGYYPHVPPLGYQSKLVDHVAVIDPVRAPFIKRAFELCATGEYTENRIASVLYKEGLRSRKERRVGKSAIGKILHTHFYYGWFVWKGELRLGHHQPIVDRDLFDKIQVMLSPKTKRGYKHDFAYVGLMRCGECGNGITAELHKGHVYYRCTKPKSAKHCSQKYVREEKIDEQLQSVVDKVSLDIQKLKTLKDIFKDSHQDEEEYLHNSLEALNSRYTLLKEKESRLLDAYLETSVKKDVYDAKSVEITSELEKVNSEISKYKNADRAYVQEIESFLDFCNQAPALYKSSRPALKRELLKFIVSNISLKDGKMECTLKIPFSIVVEYAKDENGQARVDSNHEWRFWRSQ
jgi:DNA invertase Pin-like site-specific DNA recombinase